MNKLRITITLLSVLVVFILSCSESDSPTVTQKPAPDTTAPTVLSVDPEPNETGIANAQTIQVVFSENMMASSATGNVAISPGTILGVSWSDARTLNVSHSAWGDGEKVTVTLATGLKDQAGNGLAAPYVWEFWTVTPQPMFLSSVPANGATDVNRNVQVVMLFSSDMDLTSLEAATSIGGAAVGFSLAGGAGTAVILSFDATLPATTTITIDITTAAQDTWGVNLGAAVSLSFTTGTAVDSTPPTLVSVVPGNGSTISANTSSIVFTFSEPINPDSFNPSLVSAQLMAIIQAASVSITWSPDGTALTVPLPTPLPPGIPLAATFDSYFDLAGNEQTTPLVYRVDVAGTGDPWPFVDGQRFGYVHEWSETPVIGPTNSGIGENYYQVEEQPNGSFYWASYASDSFLVSDGHDNFRKTSSVVELTGFYSDNGAGGIEDVSLSPPVQWAHLPFAVGNWNGVSTATTPGGNASIAYSVEVLGREDLLSLFDSGGSTSIVWLDCWKLTRSWSINAAGDVDIGSGTYWYVPSFGLVKAVEHEEKADGEVRDASEELFWMTFP